MVSSVQRVGPSVALVAFALTMTPGDTVAQEEYDIAIVGGRLIDPANAIDGIRNIGIVGDRVAVVTEATIRGRRVIDAAGLVVAPGLFQPPSRL